MSEFKKHFNKSKPHGFGGRPSFGGGDRPMYDAECNSCHARCQVPFRPNGSKPVYCSNCFTKESSGNDRPSSFGRPNRFESAPRPQPVHNDGLERALTEMKNELKAIHTTLHAVVAALETFAQSKTQPISEKVVETTPIAAKKVAKKAPSAKPAKKVAAKKVSKK